MTEKYKTKVMIPDTEEVGKESNFTKKNYHLLLPDGDVFNCEATSLEEATEKLQAQLKLKK